MHQNWRGARVRTGAGGDGVAGGDGGRGGDVGSHNSSETSHRNSHNDSSVCQRTNGDSYSGPVDQGDKYDGNISNSAVGGRGNSNRITNNNEANPGQGGQGLSAREIELNERINKARERLVAKRERERLRQLEDELKQLKAELRED